MLPRLKKGIMKEVKNKQWINLWKRGYKITLGNVKAYKKRLRELETWDKPFGSPSNDKKGKWREYACKRIALEELINFR